MAHADYSCCAICDSKMNYGEESTKERPCSNCYEILAKHGMTFELFVHHIKNGNTKEINDIFNECGYRPCYYWNEFDEKVKLLNEK